MPTLWSTPPSRATWASCLKVTATYTDRRSDGKTATFTMPNPVQVGRVDNNLPEFASPAVTRTVSEGAKGMEVGVPVTATDADGDILTYTKGDRRGRTTCSPSTRRPARSRPVLRWTTRPLVATPVNVQHRMHAESRSRRPTRWVATPMPRSPSPLPM